MKAELQPTMTSTNSQAPQSNDKFLDLFLQTENSSLCFFFSGEIGHFTNMVDDRNTKVGCCASKYADGGLYKWLIACDYASDNLVGIPVYLTKPDCKNGIECKKYDTEYSSLCLDHVDPNDIYYKNN